MSRLHWLASYPKSGNTWVRVLLTNFLRDGDVPADIQDLETRGNASDRRLFDDWVGVPASELTPEQVDHIRPLVYERIAAGASGHTFFKIHDAYLVDPHGMPTVTAQATAGVIYMVRNPLDVAVSLAYHLDRPLEEAVARLNDPEHCFGTSASVFKGQLRQRLLTWSGHVESWIDRCPLPVHVVRYEDLLEQPEPTLAGILAFIGLQADPARMGKAIRFSAFPVLAAQEEAHGFRERHHKAESFFRKGRAGDWRNHLTDDQVARILEGQGPMMKRLGYL